MLGRLLGGLQDGVIEWEVMVMLMCYEVICYDTECLGVGGSFFSNTTAVELLSMLLGCVI